ncbi:MAG: class I lanthipeptide [Kordia sp.]|uniref:class I lanthipeptide n=1 Tax=Kordia sp. TaxID=1965332 RepID=UPI003859BB18
MKKQSRKISLRKVVISKINLLDMHNIKGGSSVPTDSVNGETKHLSDPGDPDLTHDNCDSNGY